MLVNQSYRADILRKLIWFDYSSTFNETVLDNEAVLFDGFISCGKDGDGWRMGIIG